MRARRWRPGDRGLTGTTSSAPGKLVLLGEYAVLFGHPALVMAVNRRARVELRPSADSSWSVVAPGLQDDRIAFDLVRDGGVRWRVSDTEAIDRLVLVERVLSSLVNAGLFDPRDLDPAAMILDTREFFHSATGGSTKLGLGSSAALTVAIVDALWHWSASAKHHPIGLVELVDLHRSFQGGRGSGIDLAASTLGGVVEYRLVGEERVPSASAVDPPDGLHQIFIWTGRSASTSEFLARLDEGRRVDDGAIGETLDLLGRVTAEGANHFRDGDVPAFLDDVGRFVEVLDRLGSAAGIPILSREHLVLSELAGESGVRYKPSGAGGGDVGVGFTDDPAAAAAFTASATDAGFTILDLEIDRSGVD